MTYINFKLNLKNFKVSHGAMLAPERTRQGYLKL